MSFGFGAPHLRKCEKEGEQRRILFDLQKQRDIISVTGYKVSGQVHKMVKRSLPLYLRHVI